jgi:hypothetical protein
MPDPTKSPTPQLETHRKIAERYNVSTRTIDRWSENGILPEPVRIRGRKYWPGDVQPRRDGETA